MEWFANQRTAVKLSLSFGMMLLLLLAFIWFSHSAVVFLDNTNQNLFNHEILDLREKMGDLIHGEDEIRTSMLGAILSQDHAQQQKYFDDVRARTVINDDIIKDVSKFKTNDSNISAIIEKLKNIYEVHKKGRMDVSVPLIIKGKIDDAKKNELVSQKGRFDELKGTAISITNMIREKSNEALKLSEKEVNHTGIIFLVLAITSVIIMIVMIITLNQLISNPLNAISKAARQVASGDLKTVKLPLSNRKDEVGILIETFTEMSQWIQNVANTANQIVNGDLSGKIKLQSSKDMLGISFQPQEISEAINLLSSSATEISAASSQLAASASEAATSVNETTTTIEEVRQTSHLANLMLVNSVSDASNAAAQIAASSQQQLVVMEQATLAMENIKQTSNQNVESSKQLEISVNSIIDMGTCLKSLVGQFKLNKSAEL